VLIKPAARAYSLNLRLSSVTASRQDDSGVVTAAMLLLLLLLLTVETKRRTASVQFQQLYVANDVSRGATNQ